MEKTNNVKTNEAENAATQNSPKLSYTVKATQALSAVKNPVGYATVVFHGGLKVSGIKLMMSKDDKMFVTMPNYKGKDGEYKDYCHPITAEFREEFYENIIKAFDYKNRGKTLTFNADSKERLRFDARATTLWNQENGVRGLATVVVNDCFVLNNIRIQESKNGNMFVNPPSYKVNQYDSQGRQMYKNYFYPVTAGLQAGMKECVMDAYKDAVQAEVQEAEEVFTPEKEQAEPEKEQPEPAKKASKKQQQSKAR